MNNDDISRLKALAEAATKGEWVENESMAILGGGIESSILDRFGDPVQVIGTSEHLFLAENDRDYFLACQPKAILALLARLEEAEALAAQRDAEYHEANDDRAEYASRIAELESKLAALPSPSATIDSDELQALAESFYTSSDSNQDERYNAMITHIAARIAAADHRAWCAEVNLDMAREKLAEVQTAGMVDKPQWISMADKMPPKGESVLIFYPHDVAEPYRIDMWDEWHEDHIGMGGPTVCVGEGFMSYGDDDIEYWMPLPDAPAMSQDQKGGTK